MGKRDNAAAAHASSEDAVLEKTTCFIARSSTDQTTLVLLLGRFELPLSELVGMQGLCRKLRESINLADLGEMLPPEITCELLEGQYAAASEFVYGHPLWAAIREGNRNPLYAYMLETRHYLAAAASRMAPSVGAGIGLSPLCLLLSQHVLEEWDHATFFEDALDAIGIPPHISQASRPLPATLEWIHFSRYVSARGELAAAVCSGFMEYSSNDHAAVAGWHDFLNSAGVLPSRGVAAINGHFATDLAYGHSRYWSKAVHLVGRMNTAHVAALLDLISTLAEMIYRWLDSLHSGMAAKIVSGLQLMADEAFDATQTRISDGPRIFEASPVWPAEVLSAISHGAADYDGTMAIALGTAFALQPYVDGRSTGFSAVLRSVSDPLMRPLDAPVNAASAYELVKTWLTAIDGHELWQTMLRGPTPALVSGYLLENFHFLASATRHITPAIAACTSATVRIMLLDHLKDELEHSDILAKRLCEAGLENDPESHRPLPTTVAFLGFLQSLARQDWKAYVLVSAFLQVSLSECRPLRRTERFYENVRQLEPRFGPLLGAMADHDRIDEGLHHDGRPMRLLEKIYADGALRRDSVLLASVAQQLAWSFLDGIRSHYAAGNMAVMQRVGWRAR